MRWPLKNSVQMAGDGAIAGVAPPSFWARAARGAARGAPSNPAPARRRRIRRGMVGQAVIGRSLHPPVRAGDVAALADQGGVAFFHVPAGRLAVAPVVDVEHLVAHAPVSYT